MAKKYVITFDGEDRGEFWFNKRGKLDFSSKGVESELKERFLAMPGTEEELERQIKVSFRGRWQVKVKNDE